MLAERRRGSSAKGIRAGEEALLSSAMEAVQDLNERSLALLQRLAREQPGVLPLGLVSLASAFRDLDPLRSPNITRQPFLLVDFSFGKPAVLRELLSRGPAPLRFPALRGTLPSADATAIARGALILAQAVCRHHPAHAGLLLGLHPSLQTQVAHLRLPDLERLTEEHPEQLRVRWEHRTDVWRYLLSAAGPSGPTAQYELRLYGMQLMAGELSQRMRGAGAA